MPNMPGFSQYERRGIGLKRLGQAFVGVAFVGAVLMAAYALMAPQAQWQALGLSFGAALMLGAGGALLLSWSGRQALADDDEAGLDSAIVEEPLGRVVSTLQALNTNSESIQVTEIGPMIDAQLAEDVSHCKQAMVVLSSGPNNLTFSEVRVCFDEGHHSIRQARSASDVGNLEEVWESLSLAEERMAEAYSLLRRHRGHADHPSRN